jgi:hypothetical protein
VWFRNGQQLLLSEHPELEYVRYVNVTCKDDGTVIAQGENVIVPMTSNNSVGQVASASSVFSDSNGNYAWFAFDDKLDGGIWISGGSTYSGGNGNQWLQIDLGQSKTIGSFIVARRNWFSQYPVDYKLQGSNDGSTFVTIKQITNQSWASDVFEVTYKLDEEVTYRYYRLSVTKVPSSSETGVVAIAELQLISPDVRETRCTVKITPIMDLLNGASVYMFVGWSVLDITKFETCPNTGTLGYGAIEIGAEYVTECGLWLRSGELINGLYAIREPDAITYIAEHYFTTLVSPNLDDEPAYFLLGENLESITNDVLIYNSEDIPEIGTLAITENDALIITAAYGMWLLHNKEVIPAEFPDLVNTRFVSDTKIDYIVNTIDTRTGYVFAGWSKLDITRYTSSPMVGTLGYGYGVAAEYYETEYGVWAKTGSVISLDDYPLLTHADFIDAVGTDMLVETMTANNAPSPQVASASSTNGSNAPFRAFDNNPQTYWRSDNTIMGSGLAQWLKIDLGLSRKALRYSITEPAYGDNCPTAWKLQGSNDNTNWTDLHQMSDFTEWSAGKAQDWIIDTPNSYRYYRVYIMETVHVAYGYPMIGEFQLYSGSDVIIATVPDSPHGIPAYRFLGVPLISNKKINGGADE